MWPTDPEALTAAQTALAAEAPRPWQAPDGGWRIAGCWACFPRRITGPGAAGDPAWTAAATLRSRRVVDRSSGYGAAGERYLPGLLALRVGALLEAVVRGLRERPDVLLLDATGRDHPRRCGLAVHLGSVLDLPTVGVTHRPLYATGDWPDDRSGASSPLHLDGDLVGCWVRTRAGTRPLAVHAGWRTDTATALRVVDAALAGRRTPEPLRQARRTARRARSAHGNQVPT